MGGSQGPTAVAVAVIGLRLGERRTLAQLGAFDFAVAVAIGSIVDRTATAFSTSFATGAVALATLLVEANARRSRGIARIIDHPPRVLMAHGRLLYDKGQHNGDRRRGRARPLDEARPCRRRTRDNPVIHGWPLRASACRILPSGHPAAVVRSKPRASHRPYASRSLSQISLAVGKAGTACQSWLSGTSAVTAMVAAWR